MNFMIISFFNIDYYNKIRLENRKIYLIFLYNLKRYLINFYCEYSTVQQEKVFSWHIVMSSNISPSALVKI